MKLAEISIKIELTKKRALIKTKLRIETFDMLQVTQNRCLKKWL